MGESRNMEEKKRIGPEGHQQAVRGTQVPGASDGPPGEEGVSRGAALAVQRALERMSERDRLVFHAGILYGAATKMGEVGEQHRQNWNALNRAANAALVECTAVLGKIPVKGEPPATVAGKEAGRRLRKAVLTLLGRD